jgi:hypothetical protein
MRFFVRNINLQALALSFIIVAIGKTRADAPPYGPSQFSNIGDINEYYGLQDYNFSRT